MDIDSREKSLLRQMREDQSMSARSHAGQARRANIHTILLEAARTTLGETRTFGS